MLTGETDSSGVFVFVSGRKFSEDSVITGPGGQWHFNIGTQGARYFVKAYAPSTIEVTQEMLVDIGDGETKVAPDIVFTPAGSMRGVVTANGAPAEGARVAIEGRNRTATTDASGAYVLDRVPTGSYALRVVVEGRPSVAARDVVVRYAKETPVSPIDVK